MFYIGVVTDIFLKKSIGITTLVFVVLLIIRNIWFPKKMYSPRFWHGIILGMIAGFTSTISHAAGPIIAIYLIAQKIDKTTFVATSAIYFTVGNLMKVPPYIYSGVLTWEIFKHSLYLFPLIPVGVIVGWLANKYLPQKGFTYIVYLLLIITAIKLIIG